MNVLQDLVNNYNKRQHRSLGSNAPASVNQDNADEIILDAYLSGQKKTKSDMTINDREDLDKLKKTIEKNTRF